MKAYHTLVAGDSGGGKTTYLREAHYEWTGLSIWIDHTDAGGIDGRSMQGATTVTSVSEARQASATRLRWVTSDPIATAGNARTIAHEYYQTTGYPVQVIVDEAQLVLPDGSVADDNPVKQMLHEDRDKGLKVQLATQDPTDLDYPPTKQCRYLVLVGPMSPFSEGFVRYYGFDPDEHSGEHYRYTVYEKGNLEWKLVHQGETNPEFG